MKQEAQLMLTNPRDAFRSQSRSRVTKHSTIPHVRYSFLLLCNSVFKTRRFSDQHSTSKCRDLEIRVRGHSLKVWYH